MRLPEVTVQSLPRLYSTVNEQCSLAREIIEEELPIRSHGRYTIVEFDEANRDDYLNAMDREPFMSAVFLKNAALSERECRYAFQLKNVTDLDEYKGRIHQSHKARDLADIFTEVFSGEALVESLLVCYHKRFESDQRRQFRRAFEQYVRHVLNNNHLPAYYGADLPGEPDFVVPGPDGHAVIGEVRTINIRDWSNRRMDFLKEAKTNSQYVNTKFVAVVKLTGGADTPDKSVYRDELLTNSPHIDGVFFSDELDALASSVETWGAVKQRDLSQWVTSGNSDDGFDIDALSCHVPRNQQSNVRADGPLPGHQDTQLQLGAYGVGISNVDNWDWVKANDNPEIKNVSYLHTHVSEDELPDLYDTIDQKCVRAGELINEHFIIENHKGIPVIRFDIATRANFESAILDEHEIAVPVFTKLMGLSNRELARRHGDVGSLTALQDREDADGILQTDQIKALLDDIDDELIAPLTMYSVLHTFHVFLEFDQRRHHRNPSEGIMKQLREYGFEVKSGRNRPTDPAIIVRSKDTLKTVMIAVRRTTMLDTGKRLNHFYSQSDVLAREYPDSKFIGIFDIPDVSDRECEDIRREALTGAGDIDAFFFADEIDKVVSQLESWDIRR